MGIWDVLSEILSGKPSQKDKKGKTIIIPKKGKRWCIVDDRTKGGGIKLSLAPFKKKK